MVRALLNGRFVNTAFCLMAPDGKTRISGSGRSPGQVLRARGSRYAAHDVEQVLSEMKKVAAKYPQQGKEIDAVVPDFHTFRQALNVASSDQRLLVFVAAPETQRERLRVLLKAVANGSEVIGRFHYDFASRESDSGWAKLMTNGEKAKGSGIFVIHADAFGQQGEVITRLGLDASSAELKSALIVANKELAANESRKVYSDHVRQGRRDDVFFENGMPYGEDRDADGKIDKVPGRRR